MSALLPFMHGFLDELEKRATDLTAASRDQIKEKNFAIPDERRYPIHDMSHARAALSMVAAHGSPAEKAQVHAAVAKKYPGLAERSESIEKDGAAKEKVQKETRRGWLTPSSRKGRRPMKVDTMLRKEKEGTLGGYKFAHLLPLLKQSEALVPYADKEDGAAAARGKKPGDMPSRDDVGVAGAKREDGRGNASVVQGGNAELIDYVAQPQERPA